LKRYLVTTADESTWRDDAPLLFLGDWCLRYDRRHVWEQLDHVVAKPENQSPTDRRLALNRVQSIITNVFPWLAGALNQYHGVSYSLRHWNILLGHWLQRWVCTAMNRYLSLERALNTYELEGTTLLRPRKFSLATKDSSTFIWASNNDLWNHVLWVEVLSHMGTGVSNEKSVEIDSAPCFEKAQPKQSSSRSNHAIAHDLVRAVLQRMTRKSDAVVIGSYLPKFLEVKLHMALGQLPQRYRSPSITFPLPGDRSALAGFLSTPRERGVQGFVLDLLPRVLPTCFVEGYASLMASARALPWPSQPRFIFTSNNFDTDECFKAWAAIKSEEGTPYFTGQHGNHYGTHFYFGNQNWPERHDSDGFITWGWTDKNPKTVAGFNYKVIPKHWKMDPKGELLLIETSSAQRVQPWDVTYEHEKYLEQQFCFVDRLPKNIREHVTVRLPKDFRIFKHFEDEQWAARFPNINLNTGDSPLKSLVQKSRLVVFSYDSTGILEMLAANKPFLCFWADKWGHLNESAIPDYELLREAGIFQDSPESAANMVEKIWSNVLDWWSTIPVQLARQKFSSRYSRQTLNPARTLASLLIHKRKSFINSREKNVL
jgi:putative transferase (TIGR04331 family)